MKTLNIIGAGKLGKTLGYLFQHKNCFKLECILNKTELSAKMACEFMGAGEAVTGFENLKAADVYLLSVPDDKIISVCEQLVAKHKILNGSVVFHCSGALASTQLIAAKQAGATIASAHPIFSFSVPEQAIIGLSGSVCALEGDAEACQFLSPIFIKIGMQTFEIQASNKLLYHASLVMAGNYSVVLMAAAMAGLEQAGISNDLAKQMLHPMVINTMTQVFAVGPLQALTGPLVRGDYQLVAQELEALAARDQNLAILYQQLGQYTLNLLKAQGRAF